MNYWIFKSEPSEFGIDHLAAEKGQTTCWNGIRNYQARNNLRDRVKRGDLVYFYHSSCKNTGIAGCMEVVSEVVPDPTQFDEQSEYYDKKSSVAEPRWYSVDVRLVEKYERVISSKRLKDDPGTAGISIFKQNRLSVAPITSGQWQAIQQMKVK